MIEALRGAAYRIAVGGRALSDRDRRMAWQILRRGEQASAEELRRDRDAAFARLVRHAHARVPFYRSRMEEAGIDPRGIGSLEDLERFPPLTKEDVRAAGQDLLADDLDPSRVLLRRSGGTTGEPIRSYVSGVARALEAFSLLRGWEWMGWRPGIRMVHLFGGSLGRPASGGLAARARERAMGAIFLPAFELSRENARDYLEKIGEAGPCVLVGYASALNAPAGHALELSLPRTRVEAVFSTAETLPPDWQDRIALAFQCDVKSYYGCGEVNSLGFQIDSDGPYIVPDEHVVVESADTGPGAGGVDHAPPLLRVTALYNFAQPLIRYEMGDAGEVARPGEVHPTRSVIRRLLGRSTDLFRRLDGSPVSGSFAPHVIATTRLPVRSYQFIQRDTERVEFRYLPEPGVELTDDQRGEIRDILRRHLGDGVTVQFERSGDFIRTPAGKHRIVVVI